MNNVYIKTNGNKTLTSLFPNKDLVTIEDLCEKLEELAPEKCENGLEYMCDWGTYL